LSSFSILQNAIGLSSKDNLELISFKRLSKKVVSTRASIPSIVSFVCLTNSLNLLIKSEYLFDIDIGRPIPGGTA